jgi:hypothetical protein
VAVSKHAEQTGRECCRKKLLEDGRQIREGKETKKRRGVEKKDERNTRSVREETGKGRACDERRQSGKEEEERRRNKEESMEEERLSLFKRPKKTKIQIGKGRKDRISS